MFDFKFVTKTLELTPLIPMSSNLDLYTKEQKDANGTLIQFYPHSNPIEPLLSVVYSKDTLEILGEIPHMLKDDKPFCFIITEAADISKALSKPTDVIVGVYDPEEDKMITFEWLSTLYTMDLAIEQIKFYINHNTLSSGEILRVSLMGVKKVIKRVNKLFFLKDIAETTNPDWLPYTDLVAAAVSEFSHLHASGKIPVSTYTVIAVKENGEILPITMFKDVPDYSKLEPPYDDRWLMLTFKSEGDVLRVHVMYGHPTHSSKPIEKVMTFAGEGLDKFIKGDFSWYR